MGVMLGLGLSLTLFSVAAGRAADLAADGLTLTLDERANVAGMMVDGKTLPIAPAPLVTLCDASEGKFRAPTAISGDPKTGLSLRFEKAGASAALAVASRGGALRFACSLKGDDRPARGMLLRFEFPFDAAGWQWHNDVQTSVVMDQPKVYENVRPLRAWADLPEWKHEPDLRMGYANRNFCTVVTGPAGVCLAVPMDRPCMFRTAYDGRARRLQIVYDFALTPDTRKPNEVEFTFDLYACDPRWGFRDALARYYRLYPGLFRNLVKDPGQWMAFSRLSDIDNANEFCFGLQEGAPEPEYDDRLGVLSTVYFTHAGMGARIPDYDPEKDPLPAHDVQVRAMEASFKRRTRTDGVYHKVGLHNARGELDVRKWRVYAHLIAQFNLDPELAYGEWTLKRAVSLTERIQKTKHAELDGFYYDGLSAGINYRPDHFRTADAPCLWDPAAGKPFINNFFSSCEFARAAAELLRPRGQITMMNGALGASFYVAPWLDVLGAETGLRISRERLNYIRATTYHKPFLTLLKGNYEQKIGRREMELFMKRCLAYGVFPGFFDWPPSGLGPGGRYWYHARYYERDRDLFRKYLPLCRALATAGWEPVTHAHTSAPSVFVERFGPTPHGILWLTLLNEDTRAHKTTLTLEAAALGLDAAKVKAMDVLTGTPVVFSRRDDLLTAEAAVAADGVMVIQIADPVAAARWRVRQALKTLDRGARMRQVDKDKPPIAVHWLPRGGAYSRGIVDGKPHLVFAGGGRTARSAEQWAMLFQAKPTEVTLRVRASGEGLTGGKDAIGVRCRLAWVTTSFTYYDTRFFDLPAGTYGWKDFDFTINSDHALRSIHVTPLIGKSVKGTLRLARVSLADANRDEYVIDPEFAEWYDPVPGHMRPRLDQRTRSLRAALAGLEALPQLTAKATRQALFGVLGQCTKLREFIAAEKAENGCRRVLRDLETIERHLGIVTLAAHNIQAPTLKGPFTAAPGETVHVTFSSPEVPGVRTRTEIRCAGARTAATGRGARVIVPRDAAPGTVLHVTGLVHVGPPARAAAVGTSHDIRVVPAIEAFLSSEGANIETGACRVRIRLRNNRTRPVTARVAVRAPAGWQIQAPAALSVPASAEGTAEAHLRPTGDAAAGQVKVSVSAVAGEDTAQAQLTMLYIPRDANLLENPGFEHGTTAWSVTTGDSRVDTTVARSGRACLRLQNPGVADTTARQSVRLNQATPCAVLVRASSLARDVTGSPSKGYSLYVDIYYTDGTPLYGVTHNFPTGAADWQSGHLYIEPAKPIRDVNVYLLLRGKSGTAYFDDVALMEDPRRKGNIAREARIAVDSNYSRYDPTPINDGIVQAAGLHWTEQAWASAENDEDHFIVLDFDGPRTVAAARIYWSLDGGIPRTSEEIRVQVPEARGWRTVATAAPGEPVPETAMRLERPVTARRFRVFQPKGKGPRGRPGLMWVREVEVFPPQ